MSHYSEPQKEVFWARGISFIAASSQCSNKQKKPTTIKFPFCLSSPQTAAVHYLLKQKLPLDTSCLTVCAEHLLCELAQTLLEMFILENCVYSQVNGRSRLIDHPPTPVPGFFSSPHETPVSCMMPIHTAIKHQGGASLLLERASLFSSFPWSILVHVKANLISLILGFSPP